MSAASLPPPVLPEPVPPPEKVLRRLFLTLFLRGRGARGLNRQGAPKSVVEKLALTLGLYLLFGLMALFFHGQPVFALAVYLHAMTFVFLGMFVASSAGEVLFNKEEADILMHRPITPKTMLWAKIRMLVEVSLWLAGAFNLVGLFVGLGGSFNWLFPLAHILSTALEALFCTGCVVLVYQLCLRWFGRERLEGLMTTAQVLVSIAAVLSGQILPQLVFRLDHVLKVNEISWWMNLLPPAWFAGIDDAGAGSHLPGAWLLAGLGVGATVLVLWLAFGRLARDYEMGFQALNETVSPAAKKRRHRRWLDWLVTVPPLGWWLRDPVTRASFLLTAAYLMRDRDVKLRVYPAIAPIFVLPFVFLLGIRHEHSDAPGFGIPFAGIYAGMVSIIGVQLLQYSQQWQAGDIFRAAPMAGPAPLCQGARRAVFCLLVLPVIALMGLIIWAISGTVTDLALLLPGIIAVPAFGLLANRGGQGIPLSQPPDSAKSAERGLSMILVMVISFGLALVASWAWSAGWFGWLLGVEACLSAGVYVWLYLAISQARWPSME